jgi:hypothetical protein
MTLAGIENLFGTDIIVAAPTLPTPTAYYKALRIGDRPQRRHRRAPKPPSHHLRKFLLTYDK